MPTSAEQIAALIAAGAAWKGEADDFLANLAAHEAAYAQLSADLKGVVKNLMTFTGTIDPDDPAPTNVDGGTFNTIADLVEAAPSGARINGVLAPNSLNLIDQSFFLHNQFLHLRTDEEGVAGYATVKPTATVLDGHDSNSFNRIILRNSVLEIQYANVDLAGERANIALPWNTVGNSLISFRQAGSASVSLARCNIVGANSACIANCVGAHTITAGFEFCTFDGDVIGVAHINQGVATVADWGNTLQNGALLTNNGTLGVNLLSN